MRHTVIRTILLWPVGLLYGCIMALRNFLYFMGILKSKKYSLPVIGIGNLSTGGTGKTPHTEYILNLLKDNTAVVSRGYGRTTKGVLEVQIGMPASDTGDEPLMLKTNHPNTPLVLGERRTEAIDFLLNKYPETSAVLLDDAFQHRSVSPSVNILLTEFGNLFTHDYVLPAGNLREFRTGANRADAVVVTKCPQDLNEKAKQQLTNNIQLYTSAKVFFSAIEYGELQPSNGSNTPDSCILLTGIANPQPMVEYISATSHIAKHYRFPDHHTFSVNELKEVLNYSTEKRLPIITTSKDLMRLNSPHLKPLTDKMSLYTLPIKVKFLDDGFDAWLLSKIKSQ